ncbi:MAG TPA: 16S rRNA (guanine(966)-N(2))-methyltransferase RsmD [Tepidisphaeraceae bacterium]|jgi:16S rRNA (guanine966-N2)-methyltransferase|nr:16S rRNA (guanine(966)-N(2))-methyltransferase RsmD [Tepidisphaeraceae bacterium]
MRIIAGEFRNRKLVPPQGSLTRPITDRVKQSVFDIVSPRLENAVVYDVFAGTGSLGLESLSRGAATATFFESDRSAKALLGRNIAALGVEDRAKVVPGDVFAWFATEPDPAQPADIVFLDPPYRFLTERANELIALAGRIAATHLSPGGCVVFRHDIRDSLELAALRVFDVRDYGSMSVEFLNRI